MGRIVVGVDGSDGAARGLRWAVEEAGVRGWDVVALLTWGYIAQYHPDQPTFDPKYSEDDARKALAAFVERGLDGETSVTIEQRVVNDLPVRALLEAGAEADLLVVGARGLGGFRGLLVGSVSQEVLHHSEVPVAVVREDERAAREGRQRVVVGVDGSATSQRALLWAVDEAAARGAELEVVHSWTMPATVGYPFAVDLDPTPIEQAAAGLIDQMLEAVDTSKLPSPPIRTAALGGPRDVLLDAARHADVVVVGARGVGGFRGMLLGSVSHAVAQHAPCTAVVIPPVREG